jgi:hypothetical protein
MGALVCLRRNNIDVPWSNHRSCMGHTHEKVREISAVNTAMSLPSIHGATNAYTRARALLYAAALKPFLVVLL